MPNNTDARSATLERAAPPESFEGAMAELAQLVTQMESGQLPLEASVAAYARGSELVKFCAAQLEKVESQVKVLEGDMLKPFSSDAAGEDGQ
ncbi:MAG: exodeoxyribonuclease VII small subunit [Telluria sp.]